MLFLLLSKYFIDFSFDASCHLCTQNARLIKIKLASVVVSLKVSSLLNSKSDLRMISAIETSIKRSKSVKLKHMLILIFITVRSGDSRTSTENESETITSEKKS